MLHAGGEDRLQSRGHGPCIVQGQTGCGLGDGRQRLLLGQCRQSGVQPVELRVVERQACTQGQVGAGPHGRLGLRAKVPRVPDIDGVGQSRRQYLVGLKVAPVHPVDCRLDRQRALQQGGLQAGLVIP